MSFMRLMQRRKVDLPQPEGPMKAVTAIVGDVERDVDQRLLLAIEDADVVAPDLEAAWSLCGPSDRRGVGLDGSSLAGWRTLHGN